MDKQEQQQLEYAIDCMYEGIRAARKILADHGKVYEEKRIENMFNQEEVKETFGIKDATLLNWVYKKKLRKYKRGGRNYYDKNEVMNLAYQKASEGRLPLND